MSNQRCIINRETPCTSVHNKLKNQKQNTGDEAKTRARTRGQATSFVALAMKNMTSLQSPELATSCSDASKKPPHYDDVVVGTKFLKTVRGDKLHCRYWRRKSGTEEDEGDLKVRNT